MNGELAPVVPPGRQGADPWWRTPWVALPILAAAAGLGVAAAAVALHTRQRKHNGVPSWCHPGVGEWGGQLEGIDYVELRPADAQPNERLPMVIALHSRGMTGEKMAELASHLPGRIRVIIPEGRYDAAMGKAWTEAGQNHADYPEQLQDVAAELVAFVEAIPQCRPTVGKPVVAGYSAGADVAFALAAEAPKVIEAAVGAAGWIPSEVEPLGAPTTAIHGRKDEAVPYERTSLEVAKRVGRGEPISWVPLANVGHSFAGALQLRWLAATGKAATSARAT